VEKVQAEIVAFLVDDATADRRWVEEMAASFQAPDLEWVQICGGRVMADYGHHKKPSWLKPPLERFLSCIDFGDLPRPLQSNQWVVGTNLAVRRRLLQTLGDSMPNCAGAAAPTY
jgi:glucosyl-dolichyl phosphate glucuronosyltransferase